jgi:hypothetical protein
MAFLQRNQLDFKDITVNVTVPNNDIARLMYYLNCVCEAVEYNDADVRRFRNYNNWSSLSNEEIRVLLALCLTLSPDVFNNKVFFHSDALCGNRSNRFYEINQVSHQLLAVESIIIAGRRRQVNKIMTYTMSWITSYYVNPIKQIAERFNPQRQRLTPQYPTKTKSSSCVIS